MIQRDCNYLQAIEGEIDTAHFGYLHGGHADPARLDESEPFYFTVTNRAPEFHVTDAPWGTQYAGYRSAGPGRTYWRFANFLFPFWTQAPNGEFDSHAHARAWVPIDDHNCMYVFIWWKRARAANSLPQPAYKDGTPIGGTGRGNKLLPNTTDWMGRWRMADSEANDWGMDREAQRSNAIYSGIDGIHLQDQAITESMGPIVDHTFEHLGPSDQMITRTRRRLLRRHAPCATRHPAAGRRGRQRLSRRPQRLFRQRRPARMAGSLQAPPRRRAASGPGAGARLISFAGARHSVARS